LTLQVTQITGTTDHGKSRTPVTPLPSATSTIWISSVLMLLILFSVILTLVSELMLQLLSDSDFSSLVHGLNNPSGSNPLEAKSSASLLVPPILGKILKLPSTTALTVWTSLLVLLLMLPPVKELVSNTVLVTSVSTPIHANRRASSRSQLVPVLQMPSTLPSTVWSQSN